MHVSYTNTHKPMQNAKVLTFHDLRKSYVSDDPAQVGVCVCVYIYIYIYMVGRDRLVSIATRYGIESRWEARSSALVQAGPGEYPASSATGAGILPG